MQHVFCFCDNLINVWDLVGDGGTAKNHQDPFSIHHKREQSTLFQFEIQIWTFCFQDTGWVDKISTSYHFWYQECHQLKIGRFLQSKAYFKVNIFDKPVTECFDIGGTLYKSKSIVKTQTIQTGSAYCRSPCSFASCCFRGTKLMDTQASFPWRVNCVQYANPLGFSWPSSSLSLTSLVVVVNPSVSVMIYKKKPYKAKRHLSWQR